MLVTLDYYYSSIVVNNNVIDNNDNYDGVVDGEKLQDTIGMKTNSSRRNMSDELSQKRPKIQSKLNMSSQLINNKQQQQQQQQQ